MAPSGSAIGMVSLLQASWASVSRGEVPSNDILALLLSKVRCAAALVGQSRALEEYISRLPGTSERSSRLHVIVDCYSAA